jgi:hypothetical protein
MEPPQGLPLKTLTLRLITWEFDRFVKDSDMYSGYVIYRNDSILYNSLNSKYDTSK